MDSDNLNDETKDNILDSDAIQRHIINFLNIISDYSGNPVIHNLKQLNTAKSWMKIAIKQMENADESLDSSIRILRRIIIAYYDDPDDAPSWVLEWKSK